MGGNAVTEEQAVIDTSLIAILAWVVIAVLVILFVWKIWPLISKAVRAIDALGSLEKHMAETTSKLKDIDRQLKEVHHETHKNDGSSIKDAVTRIETKQWSEIEAAEGFRQLHTQQFGALVRKDEELEDIVNEHIQWSQDYVKQMEGRNAQPPRS